MEQEIKNDTQARDEYLSFKSSNELKASTLQASIQAKTKQNKDMNSDDSYQKELERYKENLLEAEDQLKKGNSANGDEFISNAIKECQNNIET